LRKKARFVCPCSQNQGPTKFACFPRRKTVSAERICTHPVITFGGLRKKTAHGLA
jgi:hypothetical protein